MYILYSKNLTITWTRFILFFKKENVRGFKIRKISSPSLSCWWSRVSRICREFAETFPIAARFSHIFCNKKMAVIAAGSRAFFLLCIRATPLGGRHNNLICTVHYYKQNSRQIEKNVFVYSLTVGGTKSEISLKLQ